MKSLLLTTAILWAALFMAAPTTAQSGEGDTWRPGDLAIFKSACREANSVIKLGEHAGSAVGKVLWVHLVNRDDCFLFNRPTPVMLLERIAGPFSYNEGDVGFGWRIKANLYDKLFVILTAKYGPHDPLGATI